MDRKITDLYKDYRNGGTDRRSFLKKLTLFAGGTAAALALLPVLEENELKASTPPQDDPDLVTEFIKYPAETGEMRAFLARPKWEKASGCNCDPREQGTGSAHPGCNKKDGQGRFSCDRT